MGIRCISWMFFLIKPVYTPVFTGSACVRDTREGAAHVFFAETHVYRPCRLTLSFWNWQQQLVDKNGEDWLILRMYKSTGSSLLVLLCEVNIHGQLPSFSQSIAYQKWFFRMFSRCQSSLFSPSAMSLCLIAESVPDVRGRCSCSSLSTLSINTWLHHPLVARS